MTELKKRLCPSNQNFESTQPESCG